MTFNSLCQPGLSLPEKEARKKLENIVVFALFQTKKDGLRHIVFSRKTVDDPNSAVVPLFLQKQPANQYLEAMQAGGSNLENSEILPLPLSNAFDLLDVVRETMSNQGKTFEGPIIVPHADRERAKGILLQEGISEDLIDAQMNIPVFYTNPMIEVLADGRSYQAFFISHGQLIDYIQKNIKDEGQRNKLVYKVSDLALVMQLIRETDKDVYIFHPSPSYIQVLNDKGAD